MRAIFGKPELKSALAFGLFKTYSTVEVLGSVWIFTALCNGSTSFGLMNVISEVATHISDKYWDSNL
jgi:hypothetical protein